MLYYFLLLPILFFTILTSCTNEETNIIENKEAIEIRTEKRVEASNKVLSTVPLPLEAAEIFKTEGIIYDKNYLNAVENVNNYITNTQKALNFGVYGVDLSYATIFDQTQACMLYINCSKKLAEELGLTNVFDVASIERIENNIEKKDSVLSIAEQSYRKADTYLKLTQQEELAALVLTGGWIEGLYLGTRQSAKDFDNSLVKQKINAQKQSLIELINLLESFNIANKVTKIRNQIIN